MQRPRQGPLPVRLVEQSRHARMAERALAGRERAGGAGTILGGVYYALEDDTPRRIGERLGVQPEEILNLNRSHYPTLQVTSKLYSGSAVRLPPQSGALRQPARR